VNNIFAASIQRNVLKFVVLEKKTKIYLVFYFKIISDATDFIALLRLFFHPKSVIY
jgi:hypothetical protein